MRGRQVGRWCTALALVLLAGCARAAAQPPVTAPAPSLYQQCQQQVLSALTTTDVRWVEPVTSKTTGHKTSLSGRLTFADDGSSVHWWCEATFSDADGWTFTSVGTSAG